MYMTSNLVIPIYILMARSLMDSSTIDLDPLWSTFAFPQTFLNGSFISKYIYVSWDP